MIRLFILALLILAGVLCTQTAVRIQASRDLFLAIWTDALSPGLKGVRVGKTW
jgi:hypothetical protein